MQPIILQIIGIHNNIVRIDLFPQKVIKFLGILVWGCAGIGRQA
jgi:hypothetical protein